MKGNIFLLSWRNKQITFDQGTLKVWFKVPISYLENIEVHTKVENSCCMNTILTLKVRRNIL